MFEIPTDLHELICRCLQSVPNLSCLQILSSVGAASMTPRLLEATVRALCNQPWETMEVSLEQLSAHRYAQLLLRDFTATLSIKG